jgi:hypothetical protein
MSVAGHILKETQRINRSENQSGEISLRNMHHSSKSQDRSLAQLRTVSNTTQKFFVQPAAWVSHILACSRPY